MIQNKYRKQIEKYNWKSEYETKYVFRERGITNPNKILLGMRCGDEVFEERESQVEHTIWNKKNMDSSKS